MSKIKNVLVCSVYLLLEVRVPSPAAQMMPPHEREPRTAFCPGQKMFPVARGTIDDGIRLVLRERHIIILVANHDIVL